MNKRILLVEDESIVRLDMKMMLTDAGFNVIGEAENGEKAIELVYKTKPDLIIMDIKMPKLNGLKASEIITKNFNIPILILTAYSQQDYIEKAKQLNIVGYLVKPVSEANLIPAVEIALKQAEKVNRFMKQIDELDSQLKDRKIIEQAKGVCMDRFQLTEKEAFARMRKLSMDKQVTMRNIAKEILLKYGS